MVSVFISPEPAKCVTAMGVWAEAAGSSPILRGRVRSVGYRVCLLAIVATPGRPAAFAGGVELWL